MTKTIMILSIAAAFVAGSIVTGVIAFADDDDDDDFNPLDTILALLTDATFGLEEIKNEAEKTSLQNQLLLLDLPDFKTTVDSVGRVGTFTSITIGSDGLPVISYFDFTNDDIKVAHCGNITCASATLSIIDSTGFFGSRSSITTGSDGLPVISYLDFTSFDLNVAHCDDVACTSVTLSTVDSAGVLARRRRQW